MVVRHEAEHPKRTMHSFATVPLDAIVIVGVGWWLANACNGDGRC
jgi:hypothetical protein